MTEKPRILLVTDRPGWAFDFIADELIQFASHRYDFEKIPKAEFDPKRHGRGFDAYYFFWWGPGSWQLARKARIPRARTMSVVSSFNSWQKLGWDAKRLGKELRHWSAVGVISRELEEVIQHDHPRIRLTRHGIDPERFREQQPIPREREAGELIVGWAGSLKYAELKGLTGILEPAVEKVPGARLELAVGDGGEHPNAKAYPQAQMHEFYNAIDVYVCASSNEGAPLTVLEAGACGRPVISTRVGIVPELIREGVSGLVVERTVEAVAEALRELQADRESLISMGQALKQEVLSEWTWSSRIGEYEQLFDEVIARGRQPWWKRLIQG